MHTRQNPIRRNQIRYIDEIDNRLSNLLYEVRLIANLSDTQSPQILDVDSRGLAALLERIAKDIKEIRRAIRKSWPE